MPLETVLEAYQQFRQTDACQNNPRLNANLRTALRRYILPHYGFTFSDCRRNLEICLDRLALETFLKDTTQRLEDLNQENAPASHRALSTGAINNYRSALLRFSAWVYTQRQHDFAMPPEVPAYAPSLSTGQTLTQARQGGRQLNNNPYALKPEALSTELQQQLQQLKEFWTSPNVPTRKGHAMRALTFGAYQNSLLCILGWQHNIQQQSMDQLGLHQVIDLEQLKSFIQWGMTTRGNSVGWALNLVQATIAVAKWAVEQQLFSVEITLIQALRNYLQQLRTEYSKRDQKPLGEKALTFEEIDQIVEYLKECCAPRHRGGSPRSANAVLKSWQRYLMTALLVYSPLRQHEIRELEWQRSLVREAEGYWIRLSQAKTAGKSASSQAYLLPRHLTTDLDKWLQDFRLKIKTTHAYVFIRTGSGRSSETLGEPLGARDTSDLISTAIYKATSVLSGVPKHITPHMLRSAAATYPFHFKPSISNDLAWLTQEPLPLQVLSSSENQVPQKPTPTWNDHN